MIALVVAGVDANAFGAGFGLGLFVVFTAWWASVGLSILRRLLG